jgi:hypothetical protein
MILFDRDGGFQGSVAAVTRMLVSRSFAEPAARARIGRDESDRPVSNGPAAAWDDILLQLPVTVGRLLGSVKPVTVCRSHRDEFPPFERAKRKFGFFVFGALS